MLLLRGLEQSQRLLPPHLSWCLLGGAFLVFSSCPLLPPASCPCHPSPVPITPVGVSLEEVGRHQVETMTQLALSVKMTKGERTWGPREWVGCCCDGPGRVDGGQSLEGGGEPDTLR